MSGVSDSECRLERVAYLASLVDDIEDAIIALDAQWFVTAWNKGAERMYGWTADEVMGRHTLGVARLDMSDGERADVRIAVAERGRWRGEVVAYRKDGSPISVDLLIVALRGAQGEITGHVGVHRDVSERHRAEEALGQTQWQTETVLASISGAFLAMDRQWRYTYLNDGALDRLRAWRGTALAREEILGRSMWELFPEVLGTAVERRLRDAMRSQQPVRFELFFAPTDEWVEARAVPSATGLSVHYYNISAQKSAQEEMRSRAEQQTRVAELGQHALVSDDLQALLDEAVDLVAMTLRVELAGVAELTSSGDTVFRAGVGWREGVVGRLLGRDRPESLVGYMLRRREPVIVEDMAEDRRFTASAISREHGIVSALSITIASPDEPFGALGAFSTRRRPFSQSEVSFLRAVANVLASAVERSRTQERLDKVREAERSRIARDLHDDALQALTEAVIGADRGARAGLAPAAAAALASTLRRVGEEVRGAIYDLHLTDTERRGLADAVRELVDVHRALAVDCEIELDVADAVPAEPLGSIGTELLRVLGEALANARRHADARRIDVRVSRSDRMLVAEVSDDGRGLGRTRGGHGMRGMRERADLLHGRLVVAGGPAAGTTVRLEVPLPQ
ncbi:MAG TPA: PAS domain-containing protein [Solirubrobacteraceae bacterium]|nr:PAS domain-containing protein [Solirubrobacteraceae bacterium]